MRRLPPTGKRKALIAALQATGMPARDVARVSLRVVQWSVCAQEIGHFPTTFEFAEWSGCSQRTAERYSSTMRRSLSEEELRYYVGRLSEAPADTLAGIEARATASTRLGV